MSFKFINSKHQCHPRCHIGSGVPLSKLYHRNIGIFDSGHMTTVTRPTLLKPCTTIDEALRCMVHSFSVASKSSLSGLTVSHKSLASTSNLLKHSPGVYALQSICC